MKYTNRADRLIAAGKSIKMQESAGVNPWFKYDGIKFLMTECQTQFFDPQRYEFPLAVVEGKPVFVGDELWSITNHFKIKVESTYAQTEGMTIAGDNGNRMWITDATWNQPKPKTVMVELLREDAEKCANECVSESRNMIIDACRKALEK